MTEVPRVRSSFTRENPPPDSSWAAVPSQEAGPAPAARVRGLRAPRRQARSLVLKLGLPQAAGTGSQAPEGPAEGGRVSPRGLSVPPGLRGGGGHTLSPGRAPPGLRRSLASSTALPARALGAQRPPRPRLPAAAPVRSVAGARSPARGRQTHPHRSGSCPSGSPCLSSAAGSERHTQRCHCPGGGGRWDPRSPPATAGAQGERQLALPPAPEDNDK